VVSRARALRVFARFIVLFLQLTWLMLPQQRVTGSVDRLSEGKDKSGTEAPLFRSPRIEVEKKRAAIPKDRSP